MSADFEPSPAPALSSNSPRPRFTALLMLMADLTAGQEVYSSCIRRLLTPSEWYRFKLLMHGPAQASLFPMAEALNVLRVYRERLKKGDDLYRIANARKRNRTMIGPDLFRQAETAYAAALESLEETLDDHPYLADHLSPYPDFSDWRVTSTKYGMPRLKKAFAAEPIRIYSRKISEEYAETAIEIIRGIARRELNRLERHKAAYATLARKR